MTWTAFTILVTETKKQKCFERVIILNKHGTFKQQHIWYSWKYFEIGFSWQGRPISMQTRFERLQAWVGAALCWVCSLVFGFSYYTLYHIFFVFLQGETNLDQFFWRFLYSAQSRFCCFIGGQTDKKSGLCAREFVLVWKLHVSTFVKFSKWVFSKFFYFNCNALCSSQPLLGGHCTWTQGSSCSNHEHHQHQQDHCDHQEHYTDHMTVMTVMAWPLDASHLIIITLPSPRQHQNLSRESSSWSVFLSQKKMEDKDQRPQEGEALYPPRRKLTITKKSTKQNRSSLPLSWQEWTKDDNGHTIVRHKLTISE